MSLLKGMGRFPTRAFGGYGFHWFPDDQHFSVELFQRFVPHLTEMGASWLVLRASLQPVVAAKDIAGLLKEAGVEPLLHIVPKRGQSATPARLRQAVGEWVEGGVRVVAFDDQPNLASRWPQWEPHGLPRRYARWLAPHLTVLAEFRGVTPLFPPLALGGDYWDTTFLEEALAELKAIHPSWLNRLGIACMNRLEGRSVTWGKGGPAHWGASSRAQRGEREDHLGFRSWEWAGQIADQQLGRHVETYTLVTRLSSPQGGDETAHTVEVNAVRKALASETSSPLGATFGPLADEPYSTTFKQAWFAADGTPLRQASIAALQESKQPKSRIRVSTTLPDALRVKMADGQVRQVTVEEYLRGLLPNEMSPIASMEALKAQAVALRCYLARTARAPRHESEGADLCTTDHCKLWHPNHYERTDQAVQQTVSVVAMYDGQIINASTFQRCNGRTRTSQEVWHTTLAYCRSVTCTVSGGTQQGHGVGMCRQGAQRMAEQGASFEDILRHYFTGIEVTELAVREGATAKEGSAKRAKAMDSWQPRVALQNGNGHSQWLEDAIEALMGDDSRLLPAT